MRRLVFVVPGNSAEVPLLLWNAGQVPQREIRSHSHGGGIEDLGIDMPI